MAIEIIRPERDFRERFSNIDGGIHSGMMPSGSVISVYFVNLEQQYSANLTGRYDLLTYQLKPKSKNSRFLIQYTICASYDHGSNHINTHIVRRVGGVETIINSGKDSTGSTNYTTNANKILYDDGGSDNNFHTMAGMAHDIPGSHDDLIEYKVQVSGNGTNARLTSVNRRSTDATYSAASEMVIFEIAGNRV